MIPLGLTIEERNAQRSHLQGNTRQLTGGFLLTAMLPAMVYALFAFGLVDAKPRFDPQLEIPVALVDVGGGTGSAFLVGETRLLTARHVVEDLDVGDEVALFFQNAKPAIQTPARVVWKPKDSPDPLVQLTRDVAVLELTKPTDLPDDFPRLFIGESDGVMNTDEVLVIGYPAGLPSITSGIISEEVFQGEPVFQLDVGSWHGNSGGPVVLKETQEGIGILVAGFSGEFQGINLALKMNKARELMEQDGIYIED